MDQIDKFIRNYHEQDVLQLMNNEINTIPADLSKLQQFDASLFDEFIKDPFAEQVKWDERLLAFQYAFEESGSKFLLESSQVRKSCHIRFFDLPITHDFPAFESIGKFVQIKGIVVSKNQRKFLVYRTEYTCSKCKQTFLVESEYEKMYQPEDVKKCLTPMCIGRPTASKGLPPAKNMIDYQEISLQEISDNKKQPRTLTVSLEKEMVDNVMPGQKVSICGVMKVRWGIWCLPNKEMDMFVMLRATSLRLEDIATDFYRDLAEHSILVRCDWNSDVDAVGLYGARDILVKSICPEVRGMYPIKLAVALSLATCVSRYVDEDTRLQSHMLMIGDPGLAKSRILHFVSQIASRSVFTTGLGVSSAGLTATVVKVENDWQIEGGALVLADGGVCCIDEFNLMREHDKCALLEAMEQQTITISKANMHCKLNSRCVVIAATNPKNLYNMSEALGMTDINIGINSPLLSRFDLTFVMCDEPNLNWDRAVLQHIMLEYSERDFGTDITEINDQLLYGDDIWERERLKKHFMVLREIKPEMSVEAYTVLDAYYNFCRTHVANNNENVVQNRVTPRTFDSLYRLAQAHARLLMQDKVTVLDAIVVIRLMEASWGFGILNIQTGHLIRNRLPLGPDEPQTLDVLAKLNLDITVPEKTFAGLYLSKLTSQKSVASKIDAEHTQSEILSQQSRKKHINLTVDTLFPDSSSEDEPDAETVLVQNSVYPENLEELCRLTDDEDEKVVAPAEEKIPTPVVVKIKSPKVDLSRFAFKKKKIKATINDDNVDESLEIQSSPEKSLEEQVSEDDSILLSTENSPPSFSPPRSDRRFTSQTLAKLHQFDFVKSSEPKSQEDKSTDDEETVAGDTSNSKGLNKPINYDLDVLDFFD